MKVAVIGAGNGGQTFASYFTHKGCKVALYNRNPEVLYEIEKYGGIELMGIYDFKEKIHLLTSNIAEACKDAELIMVATPANAHTDIAEQIAPFLKQGQIVVLNPGRTLGTHYFMSILKQNGLKEDIILAEADTLVYTCRLIKNGLCRVYSLKKELHVAAHNPKDTNKVCKLLKKYFNVIVPASSVLETGLTNLGVIFHPVPVILNIARIEEKNTFSHYKQGISPTVALFLEKIDEERVTVARLLGIQTDSAVKWLNKIYRTEGDTLYEALQNNHAYTEVLAPTTIHNRYIYEDIQTGLVPLSILSRELGVENSAMDCIIKLASMLYNYDFYLNGRNEKMIDFKEIIRKRIIEFAS
ncbi:NAD/NADP octopine/nopaline dehydrogenase family protein [Sedimentibacter sp. zth1]|uniref:NAD/NADP-dependent octopine/nopaline dehydrogenase family protein n=1 Tax=Sedimentibacter sp. zth1 TaxID=2816908 RepID=UPI001A933C05|nr:NAD/NADP-dependent octopine/nopaline dehydrogenase family protein [Sedimentibacter sp. zth1]QSX04694.1 NAD/NADP octopine/nopaline dehydrogenase family protein [Sedimentibacter sp. zth1]